MIDGSADESTGNALPVAVTRPSDQEPATAVPGGGGWMSLSVRLLKPLGIAASLLVASLPALLCRLESLVSDRGDLMTFWAQGFALVPGLPGSYLRVSFYFLTLKASSLNCSIGFLSSIHDRRAELGNGVNIGFLVTVGRVSIGDRCMISSRVSLMSGSRQHELRPDGKLTQFHRFQAAPIRIGADTWIGEGALIMADVGSRSIVSAGSVVAHPVPDGRIVGGNPARFIRRLQELNP